MEDIQNLIRRVQRYEEILQNTARYREVWNTELRAYIQNTLNDMIKGSGMRATTEHVTGTTNLEAVILTMGNGKSGVAQTVAQDVHRELIKHNGSLIYQQLFNGKVIVMINYPFIENYGEPRPPKTIAIYRPEELKEPFFVRHVETFIDEITRWEDYDDDQPDENQRIGFKLNFSPQEQA